MAFNPSPKVRAAGEVAKEFGKDQVVVLMINHAEGTLEYASYGKTKTDCDEAKGLADALFDHAMKWHAGRA